MDLKKHIRSIPDFPEPGILFYDISTLLAHPSAWKTTLERLSNIVKSYKPDMLVGIESRGFIVASPLAFVLDLGFIMIRKKGKLPGKTISYEYALEYGTDTIEVQEDAIRKAQRVVILDDLLATGGTMAASKALLSSIGANVVAGVCIIELNFLEGRKRIDMPIETLISYSS
ncbi:MAG: Adenine phosphoribosyltransferase [Alphaproteobacteria bacterium MarineAlpha3_Bin5]|nr:adenine phosphoribosyltransferase [Magnetovibrio sp.]PPR78445.1 MAG: Adenine phosphoribosyltransferase [Alphaproteobacteria bacterium MarineAlpha3_Bin5]